MMKLVTPLGKEIPVQEITEASVSEASKVLKCIQLLHNKFISKARKSFHPPIIIKDADEIRRRTIHRFYMVID